MHIEKVEVFWELLVLLRQTRGRIKTSHFLQDHSSSKFLTSKLKRLCALASDCLQFSFLTFSLSPLSHSLLNSKL